MGIQFQKSQLEYPRQKKQIFQGIYEPGPEAIMWLLRGTTSFWPFLAFQSSILGEVAAHNRDLWGLCKQVHFEA